VFNNFVSHIAHVKLGTELNSSRILSFLLLCVNSVKVSNDENFFKVLLKCGRQKEARQQMDTHINIDFFVGSLGNVMALETELRWQRYIYIHTHIHVCITLQISSS